MSKFSAGINKVIVKSLDLPETDELIVSGSSNLEYGQIICIGPIKTDFKDSSNVYFEGDKIYFSKSSGINLNIKGLGEIKLINITDILVSESDKENANG